MCGICGVFYFEGSTGQVDEPVLRRMTATMVHRGPDGEGLWLSSDRRVGLGHRRLAIVDLSALAVQPMTNEDGSIWITYNGEIYNHRALRDSLVRAGHRFRTDHADTEVIVHAYEEWGLECVERLDGMFAFGLWDGARQRLFLCRDRMGVKPLYFTLRGGAMLFASAIKALLAHPSTTPAVSAAALYHYLTFSTTPAPLTMFSGVYKLPAGWGLTVRAREGITAWRYWDALPPRGRYHQELDGLSAAAQDDWCATEIRRLLTAAVDTHLMSDVPMGVFLSGGLDSSTTVALMSRSMGRPVDTFTVGYRNHPYLNELEYAREVSQAFGTNHYEVLIDEREMRDCLPSMVVDQDEPIADPVCVPQRFVSRLVRDSGAIVVQVGEGSDEQFCGYDRYMHHLRDFRRYWRPMRHLPRAVRRGVAMAARAGSRLTGRGRSYAAAIDRAAHGGEHFWGYVRVFDESAKRRLLRPDRFGVGREEVPAALASMLPAAFLQPDSLAVVAHYLAEFDGRFPGADPLTRMIYLEFKLRLPEQLLMRVDKMTMSTSVEARVPFLDRALVEFSMGVPMSVKIRGAVTKHILKKACHGLIPDRIIHRRKQGFGAPVMEWLRGDFGTEAEETIMASRLRAEGYFDYAEIESLFARHRGGVNAGLPIWTLYNLTAWFDRWVDGRLPA